MNEVPEICTQMRAFELTYFKTYMDKWCNRLNKKNLDFLKQKLPWRRNVPRLQIANNVFRNPRIFHGAMAAEVPLRIKRAIDVVIRPVLSGNRLGVDSTSRPGSIGLPLPVVWLAPILYPAYSFGHFAMWLCLSPELRKTRSVSDTLDLKCKGAGLISGGLGLPAIPRFRLLSAHWLFFFFLSETDMTSHKKKK